jgi:hypothetical protein
MRTTRWWVFYPGEVYANNCDFRVPIAESQFRAWLRNFHKVERLPRGIQIWPDRNRAVRERCPK